jgi:hypothetical protein
VVVTRAADAPPLRYLRSDWLDFPLPVGRLRGGGTDLVDDGTVFRFPTDSRGRTVYRTVEGVSWLGDDRVVVVSDKVKPGAGEGSGRAKDQSIHIFTIPTSADGQGA